MLRRRVTLQNKQLFHCCILHFWADRIAAMKPVHLQKNLVGLHRVAFPFPTVALLFAWLCFESKSGVILRDIYTYNKSQLMLVLYRGICCFNSLRRNIFFFIVYVFFVIIHLLLWLHQTINCKVTLSRLRMLWIQLVFQAE